MLSLKLILFGFFSVFGINYVDCDEFHKTRTRRSFQNLVFEQPDRGGRKCHDFCAMMPDLCRNGGTCITDEITCQGRCVCTPGWKGRWCREATEVTDAEEDLPKTKDLSDSMHVLEDKSVDMETPSIVQKIRDGLIKGVQKTFITEEDKSTKPTLTAQDSTSEASVKVGSSLESSDENKLLDTSSDRVVRETCEKECIDGECIKINNIYKCKQRINVTESSAPRVCGPGFECRHGVCDMEALKKNYYKCICESNYVGQFCTKQCPFDCGEHGYCDIHRPDNTYKCFCQWNYTGLNCSEPIPEEPEFLPSEVLFHWYVVGVSVAVMVVAVSAIFVVGYCMWRRRLVFMLKIVHYFQDYEEDDGKEYDAFVSYKSSPRDEEFVLTQLYPKLEVEHKFKLCLHFRDFIPGEAIANNIVRAIESSRRTIMVLSPEYVRSEWCRMEYQKAQHEMLKLKHKIIPVVLEDVTKVKDMDKNLKSIISSVTYLEWPGLENSKKTDRFWKKLQLSLPKKSAQSLVLDSTSEMISVPIIEETGTTPSELVSSVSAPSHLPSAVTTSSPTDSPALSSTTSESDSSKTHRKRKDFKHFMDKLVNSKLFGRQDSSSSQAALVDDDTIASRSSCGSVSDSMLSESTESVCSTPDTARSSLREIDETQEPELCLTSCSSDVDLRGVEQRYFRRNAAKYSSIQRRRRSKFLRRQKERVRHKECEKDHCDDAECSSCAKHQSQELSTQSFVNRGFKADQKGDVCLECAYLRKKSDNNRIKVTPVDGSDGIRIERLPPDLSCDHVTEYENVFRRSDLYRGSIKEHKDAKNLEIVMQQKQNRVGSLPKNYKSTQTKKQTLNVSDLFLNESFNMATDERNRNSYSGLYENV